MFQMEHDIVFNNQGKKFKLQLLNSVEITSSVDNLVDTAVIVLPESVLNDVLKIEDKISRGTHVTIQLGYEKPLRTEFTGYITDIMNKSGSLNISCEDALFLFRKTIKDKVFKPASVKDILQYLLNEIDPSFQLVMDADYGIVYDKFTIYQAEAYDILKKIQDELKADIYFDTEKKELHFHAPYKHEGGVVAYDMRVNIESSSLEYKKAKDRVVEVVVESTGKDGTTKQVTAGTKGGQQVKIQVGSMSENDMAKVADSMLVQQNSDRYEGSFDTWLIPFVRPAYRAKFRDSDYPDRNGSYYVTSVTTSFSESGGKRTVNLGIKLWDNTTK